MSNKEPTWYLLYGGTSCDGRGRGHYIGRTTDENVAREHHLKCRSRWDSIGFVLIVSDKKMIDTLYWTPREWRSKR